MQNHAAASAIPMASRYTDAALIKGIVLQHC
jgi:hypothetical protein